MAKKVVRCPRCGAGKIYRVRRGYARCAGCGYEWRPGRMPLKLTREEWRRVLHLFLLGLSSNKITEETGLQKKRVLRALTKAREVMARDVPAPFAGTVEIDETYVGGLHRNRRRKVRKNKAKRGRGTLKTPVFGILCRGGFVWAQVVPDTTAVTLLPLLEGQVKKGSTVCSDTWGPYTGVAYRGYVHRLVAHGDGQYADAAGNHINGLEGFWGYLKRQLAAKGGIRKERLPLYLAEYVWKYNHRKTPTKTQENALVKLLENEALKPNFRG